MKQEIGQIKLFKTESGMRIEVCGDLMKDLGCCCSETTSDDRAESDQSACCGTSTESKESDKNRKCC